MSPEFDSPALSAATAIARQLAATRSVPVLIAAESGAPAEELARFIHVASGNAPDRNWVAVRCRGLPERVIEVELFGDSDGNSRAAGMRPAIEHARPGTLFIESISDLSVTAQTQLEAFIETERQLDDATTRDAGARASAAPVRVVATASIDLKSAVRQRRFRAGLLEQLSVITISIPPLRTRLPDIVRLARRYARDCGRAAGKEIAALSPEATAKLADYPYPGNERELRAVIERAVIVERTATLGADSVSFSTGEGAHDLFPGYAPSRFAQEHGRPPTLSQIERAYIAWMLKYTDGNRTAASRLLGISYPTIVKKMNDYGIDLREILQ
jgi:DNA-binding NtrC family response regulator